MTENLGLGLLLAGAAITALALSTSTLWVGIGLEEAKSDEAAVSSRYEGRRTDRAGATAAARRDGSLLDRVGAGVAFAATLSAVTGWLAAEYGTPRRVKWTEKERRTKDELLQED